MERQQLIDYLAGDSEAWAACRSALIAGARFHVEEEAVPVERLWHTFRRRERTVRRRGQPSIGFARAVSDLAAYDEDDVIVGHVDNRPEGGWYFQLFFDADRSRVVACLGVRPSGVQEGSAARGRGGTDAVDAGPGAWRRAPGTLDDDHDGPSSA